MSHEVIGSQPTLLPDNVIQRAKQLSSTLLSDAMGRTGGMDYRIKPVSDGMKMFGTAMTVSMAPGDNLFLHQAIYTGQEGYVLVADGKGHEANAYLGELMAGAAKAVGLEGLVIDGLVRDKHALNELNFPIFAKGFISNGPFKEGPGELNTSIQCGGIAVHAGDLIVGDDDGVVVVPRANIEEVFAQAEKKLKYERERLKVIAEYEDKRMQGLEGGSIEPDWLKAEMDKFLI
jgi:4-hydroxy-4-methyl-2-oxoglutarate aldolase